MPISAKMNKLMNYWKYRSAKYQERGTVIYTVIGIIYAFVIHRANASDHPGHSL